MIATFALDYQIVRFGADTFTLYMVSLKEPFTTTLSHQYSSVNNRGCEHLNIFYYFFVVMISS